MTRANKLGLLGWVLQIRKRQLAVFREARLASFTDEMVAHMRRVMPEQVHALDDEALAGSLGRRIRAALALGITDRFDVLRYLECGYALGWNDEGPDDDARAVLSQEGLGLAEKLDLIEQRTVPR